MSVTETLRTHADNLLAELHRLQVENAKLREEKPEDAALVDQVEALQQENEEERRRNEQLQEECLCLQSKLAWEQKEAELSR